MLFKQQTNVSIPKSSTRFMRNGIEYAQWINKQGNKVTYKIRRNKQGKEYVSIQSLTWHARYKDSTGKSIQINTKCTDKQSAQRFLDKRIIRKEQVIAGVLDVEQEHAKQTPVKTVNEILGEYLEFLKSKHTSKNHVYYTKYTINNLGVQFLKEITRQLIENYLKCLREKNKSFRTINYQRVLIHGFLQYCLRHDYIKENPCANIPCFNESLDRKYVRRALTDKEIESLLKVTAGTDRQLIYKVLITTGIRIGELRGVTVSDVSFTYSLYIRIDAIHSKSRKYDTVPLTRELSSELKEYVVNACIVGKMPLFKIGDKFVKTLNRDLLTAKIPKETEQGIIDVHSLRHTCATRLARNGVPVSIAQRILRHSDPKLTMSVYSHLGISDTQNYLEQLPKLEAK